MKTVLGILPVILALPSYAHYLLSVFKRKIVPHTYSWLIWSILAAISYAAQIRAHAGPGAWNTGITAVVCFIIFLSAIKYGEHRLQKLDSILLLAAAAAIAALLLIKSGALAILLSTAAASVGFILTIKKAYKRPEQEDSTTFTLNGLRNLISLFALSSITFTTFFYPFCMMLANFAVVACVLLRRKHV